MAGDIVVTMMPEAHRIEVDRQTARRPKSLATEGKGE